MGEALKAFWQGLCEAPRAFVAPVFSALESVRKVFEAGDKRHEEQKKRSIPH